MLIINLLKKLIIKEKLNANTSKKKEFEKPLYYNFYRVKDKLPDGNVTLWGSVEWSLPLPKIGDTFYYKDVLYEIVEVQRYSYYQALNNFGVKEVNDDAQAPQNH